MKVILDTNVLISATFWEGDSSKIVKKVEDKEIELILSKDILDEFKGVLGYKEIQEKIKNKNLEMKRTVEKIISISSIVEPKNRFNVVEGDSDDDKFLECAVEGNANFIVSQDNHLLKLKEFKGIKILTPSAFLNHQALQQP